MSEIKKNIETCRGEDVLAEVSGLPQDPHFGSLVNEALDPLKQQALHQAGYDGYSEVIEQHKPYTFASAIVQMKSNLLLLLRALWQFPFGSGTLRSLSDMWQHYITRLQGSETYGIPSRLSSLTDLPSAPLLVADRKISGVPEAVDGISLVHLLFGAYADIEELTDDKEDWGAPRQISIMSLFPNLKKLTLGISSLNWMLLDGATGITEFYLPYLKTISGYPFRNSFAATCELNFPEWNYVTFGSNFSPCIQGCGFKKFSAPKMQIVRSTGTNSPCFYNCPNLEEIDMPALEYCNHWGVTTRGGGLANNCPKLWKVRVGDLSYGTISGTSGTSANGMGFPDCPKLIHLELGANGVDVSVSVDMRWWEPDSETLANPLFLQNFRTYIALRLATFASNGPTLTLSQAVYDAIKDESHLFVFDEGTMTIYAYLTNIKHWTVTK